MNKLLEESSIRVKSRPQYDEDANRIIFTVHKRSCKKVMFSQACVKNSVHGGQAYTPLLGRHPPGQIFSHTSPCTDTLPPPRRPFQRMVRILLECILIIVAHGEVMEQHSILHTVPNFARAPLKERRFAHGPITGRIRIKVLTTLPMTISSFLIQFETL